MGSVVKFNFVVISALPESHVIAKYLITSKNYRISRFLVPIPDDDDLAEPLSSTT